MNTVKSLLFIFVCSVAALLVNAGKASAQTTSDGWVKNTKIEVSWNNPKRSRRSPDATVTAQITNNGDEPITGPIHFVIESLTPATMSVGNADGKLDELDYVVALPEDQVLAPGQSLTVGPITIAGGRNSFNISGSAYVQVSQEPVALEVDILTPATLTTFGSSPVTVTGTINQENAELTLNGAVIAHDGKQFSANVELTEGFNTVVARATNASGEQTTDSISVSLDLTPPYVTIESHTEAQEVYSDKITVTGLVNDIVRGTVSEEQATVEVNGVKATVSNRSYAASDVPLNEGENVITVTAIDESGNSASISQKVIYKIVTDKRLVLVSGQNQTAQIGNKLPERLVVKLLDGSDAPIEDATVVFRVTQGAGIVGSTPETSGRAIIAKTDAEGVASTEFQVGYRTGVANHKVRAKVVGVENEVIFPASATSVSGDKISVNSGNNQRGVVGQTLPAPFVVAVTDSGANVVQGARVRFNVIKGDGIFQNEESSYETSTDSDGRASAQLTLGPLTGIDAQRVEAVLIDSPEGVDLLAGFSATAFVPADAGITSVSGVVLDNQDKPLPGVTVRIEGTDRTAFTDQQGRFTITQAPVGPVHLIVDGSTTTAFGEYPTLSYHIVTVSGVDNPLSGPIYMVKLDTDNGVFAGKEDVVLTLDNFPGFKLEIAKDSVTFPDGSREGIVSVTSVNASKVPMAPPNGMQPQFIVTIQPVGATFSPAAKLSLPNVDGHAPGAQVEMYSYDHDLEEFVAIGLGTVSEDGSVVSSNPGVGVVKAGWHCGSQPGGSGTAHNCPECQKCQGSSCVRDPAQDNKPLSKQTPEDCKTQLCKGYKANSGDIPVSADVKFDCKKPGCNGANPIFDVPENSDISDEDKICKFCSGGSLNNKPDNTPIEGEECKECVGGTETNKPDGTEFEGEECKECRGGVKENKPDGTEFDGEGEECKECRGGVKDNKPDGETPKPDDLCKVCKNGSLVDKVSPDELTVIPSDPNLSLDLDRAKPLTDAIQSGLRRIGINANVGLEASVSYKQGPCCNPQDGVVVEDEVTEAQGAVGLSVKVEGRIPGLSAGIPSQNFDRGGFHFSLDAGIGLKASIDLKFTGTFGQRAEDCIGEGEECAFGKLDVNFTPALSAILEAIVCAHVDALGVKIGGCTGVDGNLTVSAGISYGKSMNMPTCAAGTSGGGNVEEIAVTGSIKIILGTDDFGFSLAKIVIKNGFPI